jgi:hypothetical protein
MDLMLRIIAPKNGGYAHEFETGWIPPVVQSYIIFYITQGPIKQRFGGVLVSVFATLN